MRELRGIATTKSGDMRTASTAVGPRRSSRSQVNKRRQPRIVKLLADESANLSAANDKSPIELQGYLDGESCRQRGGDPSAYEQVGIDGYALSFRAGYHKRRTMNRTGHGGETPVAEMHLTVSSRVNNSKTAGADLTEPFPNPA